MFQFNQAMFLRKMMKGFGFDQQWVKKAQNSQYTSSSKVLPFYLGKWGPFTCSLYMVTFQVIAPHLPRQVQPMYLLSLFSYSPGKCSIFTQVNKAHLPSKYLSFYQSQQPPLCQQSFYYLYIFLTHQPTQPLHDLINVHRLCSIAVSILFCQRIIFLLLTFNIL